MLCNQEKMLGGSLSSVLALGLGFKEGLSQPNFYDKTREDGLSGDGRWDVQKGRSARLIFRRLAKVTHSFTIHRKTPTLVS